MKFTLIFALMLIPLFCFSQNLQNLDLKYGFNKFKLESSYSSYSKDLKYKLTDKKNGAIYYTYAKKDINIFGYNEIEEIALGFYKGRLYTISIYMNPIDNENVYKTVYSKLKELFGYPTTSTRTSTELDENDSKFYLDNINQWKTLNTLLGINTIKCSSPVSPCRINIFMVSLKLQREINNDGF